MILRDELVEKFKGGLSVGEHPYEDLLTVDEDHTTDNKLYFWMYDANFMQCDYKRCSDTYKKLINKQVLEIVNDPDVKVYIDKVRVK